MYVRNKLILDVNKLRLWIDIIIVVLLSGTVYKLMYSWSIYLVIVPLVLHLKDMISHKTNARPLLVGILFMISTTMLINLLEGTINFYVILLIDVLAMFAICCTYDLYDIAHVFNKLMTVLAIISLIYYFLEQSTNILYNTKTIIAGNGISYSLFFLCTYSTNADGRNEGIFWEPGIFATMLVVGLVFSLYIWKNDRMRGNNSIKEIFRIVIYIVTLLTTSSSAGIILFGFYLVLFVVANLNEKQSVAKALITWIMLIAVLLLIFNYESLLVVFGLENDYFFSRISTLEKLTKNARWLFWLENIEYFLRSPIIGHGIIKTNQLVVNGADTATTVYSMVVFGILGIQYTLYFVAGIIKTNMNYLSKFVVICMILFIINKEPHLQMMLSWLLMFSIYNQGNKALEDKKYSEISIEGA